MTFVLWVVGILVLSFVVGLFIDDDGYWGNFFR